MRPPDPEALHRASKGDSGSLRAERDGLVAQVLEGALAPGAFPARYADAADRRLAELFDRATAGKHRGLALVAVGGYGRRELCPGSDLDLVLIHRRRRNFDQVAKQLWYAIWDDGLKLDHSVRTRADALAVAREDLKAVLGLLDGRVVAGDARIAEPVLAGALDIWRTKRSTYVVELDESVRLRHRSSGELAFLLEPDLKQSAGGLRDLAALRALALALPELTALLLSRQLESPEQTVLATRVALHCRTGTTNDRLALQEQDELARLLDFESADALMAAIAEAGRTIAATCAEGWRRVHARALHPGGGNGVPVAVERGIVLVDGEIALGADAAPATDPGLLLRVARAAATRNALLSVEALERLRAELAPLPDPWEPEMRADFLTLLGTGDALVAVVEALDQHRLFERVLPEWLAVRNKPQRNAYHRYTVDRHLLEAVARASDVASRVERVDLLLMGALLHDIGKGFEGDHSEVGQAVAHRIATRIGFSPEDVARITGLVAYHLVLPEVATRRDLEDPSTSVVVAKLVGERTMLELFAALTEADSRATGSSAWSPWKAELVAVLTERVGLILDGASPASALPPTPTPEQLDVLAAGRLALRASGRSVTVVAPDRPGLLAAVAGVLALHGCNVLRARAGVGAPGMALEIYDVEPLFDRVPSWDRVERDVAGALAGELALDERLREQDRTYASYRRPTSAYPPVLRVTVDNDASALSTVLEVRAPDSFGLLHRVTEALADAGLDVVSALVDTLGHEVIDTFYIREDGGAKVLDPARIEAVRAAVTAAIVPA